MRLYLKKAITKIGLVEWLKVKALSSSPSTVKKKKISLF
jgi:ribosomal protein S21